MSSYPISLPPLSSFDFFAASKAPAPAPVTLAALAVPLSRRSSFSSGGDSSSSSSPSASPLGPPAGDAFSPLGTAVALPAAQHGLQRPLVLSGGGDRQRRPSATQQARQVKASAQENDGWGSYGSHVVHQRIAHDDDDLSLGARGRTWSFDSDDDGAMDVDREQAAAHSSAARQWSPLRSSASSASVLSSPFASSGGMPARSPTHSRQTSSDFQALFRSTHLVDGEDRPALDRRALSESHMQPTQPSRTFPAGIDRPSTPPSSDRNHPYQRAAGSASVSPASTAAPRPPRLVSVAASQTLEFGRDPRGAFSRSSQACDACRSRKTRCTTLDDGSPACGRCGELGLPCTWTETVRKRCVSESHASTPLLPQDADRDPLALPLFRRPKNSRSESSLQAFARRPSEPEPSPFDSALASASGWTSTIPPASFTMALTSFVSAERAPSVLLQPSPPLPCSGWSQPPQAAQRPPARAERRRPQSEVFPPTFARRDDSTPYGWQSTSIPSTPGRVPSPPYHAGRSPSRPPVGLGFEHAAAPDDHLAFGADNSLTLPPLRVALGRASYSF